MIETSWFTLRLAANRKFYLAILFLSAFVCLTPTSIYAQNKPLHFACSNFPPYIFENRERPGISLEIISAALAVTGRKANFQFYPWKRAFNLVENGKADALCGCSYRKTRETKFYFSDMLGVISQGIFRKQSIASSRISTLSDLGGLSVATIGGYALQKELEKKGIASTGVVDEMQLVKMLITSRIDSIYAYRDVVLFRLSRLGETENLDYSEISSQPHYACFSRTIANSKTVQEEFNKGLRYIRMTGQYDKIRAKYLSLH